jgi:hypothetical protein
MSSIEARFQTLINNETKKVKTLSSSLQNIYDTELDLRMDRQKIFETIRNFNKGNENFQADNIYNQFCSKMLRIEDCRKEKINSQNDALKALKCFPEKIKGIKEGGIPIYRNNGQENKSENQIEANTPDKKFLLAEIERRKDYKYLFLNLISNELEYHAKALEELTRLFKTINLTDPNENIEDFIKRNNIQTNPESVGLDFQKIRKNKEEKQAKINEDQQRRDSFFKNDNK